MILNIVWMCLLATAAMAIPLEIKEPGFTLSLPEGFKEVLGDESSAEATRLFVRGTSDDGRSNTYLTVSRITTNVSPSFWPEGDRNGTRIIGRYSERLNNQDIAVLVSHVTSNNSVAIEQSAQVPLDPGTILLDLRTQTDDDKEAQALMKKIIQSLATQAQQAERTEIQGWRGAVVCLAMVAAVLLVAIARR